MPPVLFLIRVSSLKVGKQYHASSQVVLQQQRSVFAPTDQFKARHMGSQGKEKQQMLKKVGFESLEALIDSAVPPHIRLPERLVMDPALSETEALSKLKGIMSKNKVYKSFIGMGYHETLVPGVILRNVRELEK